MADLTCSACLEPFKDPKVLPCLHSFCHGCIVNLTKKTDAIGLAKKINTINCPKCRLVVEVNENTVSSLPSNFFVNNLLAAKALTNDKASAKKILCENCNGKDPVAESRCNVCAIFLCQYCTESHKRYRSTEHHKLLSMEELKSNPAPQTIAEKIRCPKHKEEIIKLFCKTCQTTICRDCTIVDHRQHEYGFVEEVAFKEKQHLQSNLNEVKQRKDRVAQGIANLKNFNNDLEEKKNSTILEISRHFNELVNAAEFRKGEMIQIATSLTNAKQKQIRAQLDVLEVALATCESSIEFTELAFTNGNDVQILSMEKNILQSLQQLKAVKDQTKPSVTEDMTFVIPSSVQETKQMLLNHYGVFNCVACPENCHAFFNEVEQAETFSGYYFYRKPELSGKKNSHCEKAERFLEVGKQHVAVQQHVAEVHFITLICNDKNKGRLKHGGDNIKPSFTGMEVSDVAVADNNDGSYSISFCPGQVGMLKFEVSINGVPAPKCSLTKQVKWIISDAHGKGVITDGGLTMKGEGGEGEYCWRIGGCYFDSGVHTWKVRLSIVNSRDMTRYGSYSRYRTGEVGIIDSNKVNENDVQRERKWVYKHTVQDSDNEICFTLDMENKTLNATSKSGHGISSCVMNTRLTAQRVSPFFGCWSPYVSISLVQ